MLPCLASAFPKCWVGRRPRLYFRGLLKVHSRYGPMVCSPPKASFCPRSFNEEVSLPRCPGSYRDEPTISRAELSSAGILRPRGAPTSCALPNPQNPFRLCHFPRFPSLHEFCGNHLAINTLPGRKGPFQGESAKPGKLPIRRPGPICGKPFAFGRAKKSRQPLVFY